MGEVRVLVEESEPETMVRTVRELEEALSHASFGAKQAGLFNIVTLTAPNGDWMSLVVGGDETVVSYNHGHGDPPYYASLREADSDDPAFTAFVSLKHHTEFPRRWVVPMSSGWQAAAEFLETGRRPTNLRWVEV